MNEKNLLKVALRYKALYLDIKKENIDMSSEITPIVYSLMERLGENDFCVSEELLHALVAMPEGTLADIVTTINDVMGVNLNWAPLVKGWNVPTGETRTDHFITWIANELKSNLNIKGTTLPCGHLIPEGTFPLERYNGCPYCGKPFRNPDGTCIFEISVVLNFEFYSAMMSYGPGVKVLSPRIAVHCMKEKTKAMAKLYEDTEGDPMDGGFGTY